MSVTKHPILPILEHRARLIEQLEKYPVIIVCGETGSGKTTQIPQICLDMGRGKQGMIGCTQPRRIAARSIAHRIAQEQQCPLGGLVGYQTRFQRVVSAQTRLKIMTDGILLAEIEQDPTLSAYDTLIIDEAHERSLNIDLLLGYCRQLSPKRPDLKIIITSATIDTERFSQHFQQAPILNIAGRLYPVEVRYRPLEERLADQFDTPPDNYHPSMRIQAIVDAVDELFYQLSGNILVFCSGEREIREATEALASYRPYAEILPLFARLSHAEQDRIFQNNSIRRIILATNVAETSLTVPGIQAVIDTGHARISRYNLHHKIQRLPIEPISRASADQRKGRCGRLQNGICIRLYSEADYHQRRAFTEPEIVRTSLAATLLKMKALKLGEIETFPFLDAPSPKLIKDGLRLLTELGALDEQAQLTPLGYQMSRLPLEPRMARIILAAHHENCLREILIIVSALTAQDPRERPADQQAQADQAHRRFHDVKSDFSSYLTLWDFYQQARQTLSKNKLRQWCQAHYLSWLRLTEWHDIHAQLLALIEEIKIEDKTLILNTQPADYAAIHRALLTGFLGHIGVKQEQQDYLGTRGSRWWLFPASSLFKRKPAWCMAAELIETSRLYAHCVAQIEPEWIEQVAGSRCSRHYFEPHWQKNTGQVAAYERVTLYGLTLIARRRVNFGPIDPVQAREIFIREALVHGELHTKGAFMAHNQALLQDLHALEHKIRRHDLVVDEAQLYAFFEQRLPADIYNAPAFERWRRLAERDHPHLLYWQPQDIIQNNDPLTEAQRYPESLSIQEMTFPLKYCFNPGAIDDGVSLQVPLSALNRLDEQRLAWLVPGLIEEKIQALLKTLPKAQRRLFIPVPHFAQACWQALAPNYGQGCLYTALSQQLQRMTGITVPRAAWPVEQLPPHLIFNIQILDEQGQILAQHRDWNLLQQQWGRQAQQQFKQQQQAQAISNPLLNAPPTTRWDFGELPALLTWQQQGMTLSGYPALVDKGHQVHIELVETEIKAQQLSRSGILRLACLGLEKELQNCYRQQRIKPEIRYRTPILGYETVKELLLPLLTPAIPRTPTAFNTLLATIKPLLGPAFQKKAALVETILQAHHQLNTNFNNLPPSFALASLTDFRQHWAHLMPADFIEKTPAAWLPHLPRYLTALQLRLQRLLQNPAKDQQKVLQIQPYWQAYLTSPPPLNDAQALANETYRWLLEEFRVSLFAQELKTAIPVSIKRLEQHWQALYNNKAQDRIHA